jgi:hypothetical protein
MTLEEWQTCADPHEMLKFVRGSASDRELRLFASACCRRIWSHMSDKSRAAVEVAERFAVGTATEQELAAAESEAWRVTNLLLDALVATPKEERRSIRVQVEASKAAAEAAVCRMRQPKEDGSGQLASNNSRVWAAAWVVSSIVTGAVRRSLQDRDRAEVETEERAAHAELLRGIKGRYKTWEEPSSLR